MESKYAKYELAGEVREKAKDGCLLQIASWGLKMPEVKPLLLHFGLNDFYRIGEIEFWIANKLNEGYCGKFLFVFAGQTCPYHYHKIKHETFFIVKGKVGMKVNREYREKRAGDILEMSPGDKHSFTGLGPALLLEVSMPSIGGDNFFEDKSIGDTGGI
jgi:N-acetylneuraminate synthase